MARTASQDQVKIEVVFMTLREQLEKYIPYDEQEERDKENKNGCCLSYYK